VSSISLGHRGATAPARHILDNALAEVGRAILQITVERGWANYFTQSA